MFASIISLVALWLSVPVASADQNRLSVTASIALAVHVIAIAASVVALVFYRARGLWVVLAAIPALFVPVLAALFIASCAIHGCN
jgi:hypothetical protein